MNFRLRWRYMLALGALLLVACQQPAPTGTPTPTPTATHTPVPGATATLTPTIAVSPLATPTPTSAPASAASPTPTPTLAAPRGAETPRLPSPTPTPTRTPAIRASSPTPTTAPTPSVLEIAEIENYAANRFYPDRFVVVKGIPVTLHITRLHSEHVNRFTIDPWVASTAFFTPGTLGVIEFTPDRTGEFRIRNEGHGYQAALSVVDSIEEAKARSVSTGVQELSLIHDFANSRIAPQRLVVQQGVPVKIYNTGLQGQDKVSIAPFYMPTGINVEHRKITVFEFTPVMAGEFPITYEQHKISGTLVVEPRP